MPEEGSRPRYDTIISRSDAFVHEFATRSHEDSSLVSPSLNPVQRIRVQPTENVI